MPIEVDKRGMHQSVSRDDFAKFPGEDAGVILEDHPARRGGNYGPRPSVP